MNQNAAIGIFDSGLGGLTVARAVREAFPGESICYLGDTARVPYGTKSSDTVKLYARENIAFLRQRGVKAIIAACNTVSAAALPALEGVCDVPLLGVVDKGAEAVVAALGENQDSIRVGVIGTETTVSSEAYIRAIQELTPGAQVVQRACPLFVPLIEEGWFEHDVTRAVIAEYLSPMRESGIDALILGCTHYPLIRGPLADFFGPSVRIVDSAEAMVRALGRAFESGLLQRAETPRPDDQYFVTDRYHRFGELLRAFMGIDDLKVQQIPAEELVVALQRNG